MQVHPEVGQMTISMALIAVTAIVWLIWDIIAYVKDKKTISYYFVNWSWYSPMVPLIFGILIGHWFW